jgi:hypothetical protein
MAAATATDVNVDMHTHDYHWTSELGSYTELCNYVYIDIVITSLNKITKALNST